MSFFNCTFLRKNDQNGSALHACFRWSWMVGSFVYVVATYELLECYIRMDFFPFLIFFNATAFIIYGLSCLFSNKMKVEFARFRLSKLQRQITGISQVLASIGIVVGFYFSPVLLALSCLGLSLQMMAGFIVRINIRDSFAQSFPAFFFMLLNALLAYRSFLLLN
jgi:hypothetical protein